MKKITLIAALLLTASCNHYNQKIALTTSFAAKQPIEDNSTTLNLKVFDDRKDKEILGTKEYGEAKIKISAEKNLASFLRDKIAANLAEAGFAAGKDKNVEIHIETLTYHAYQHFPTSNSKAESIIRVVVTSPKNKTKFVKNYTLTLNGQHFLVPLERTDAKILNNLIQETFQDVLSDEAFIKALRK